MPEPIGNNENHSDLSLGLAADGARPFFILGEPLKLVISLSKKTDACSPELLKIDSQESPQRLDTPVRLLPMDECFNPWGEAPAPVEGADNLFWDEPIEAGYVEDEIVIDERQSKNIEQIARELLAVVKKELRDGNGNVSRYGERKLAEAFRTSSNPSSLADMLTTLGRAEHIQVGYDHAIHFYNYQSVNGMIFRGGGVLFEYNGQIAQGQQLGVSKEQIKPLADTVREATTLEGDFTRLALADIGIKPDVSLLERAKFMNAVLANTGNPKQLVDLLNRQISQDEQALNRHGLNYVYEVRIRIDYPRLPRAVTDRAFGDSTTPRLQVIDPGSTFFWTIDLNK